MTFCVYEPYWIVRVCKSCLDRVNNGFSIVFVKPNMTCIINKSKITNLNMIQLIIVKDDMTCVTCLLIL